MMPNHDLAERAWTLWMLPLSPAVWAAHFMLCYVTAAIWCAKLPGPDGSLSTVRLTIAVYTAVALVTIGIVGTIGFRWHRFGSAERPHDDDSPEDRHRFTGFATLLLSGLSAVAVCYSALVVVFIRSCE